MRCSQRRRARGLWATTIVLAVVLGAGCTSGATPAPTAGRAKLAGGALPARSDPTVQPSAWTPRPDEAAPPRIAAASVIVENLDTGAILFAKDPDGRRPIASLAKVMTAMVVLQTTQPTDLVAVSKLAASQRPTSLGLRPGQRMDVHDLLYALLLHSSNDVAVALAEHVAGSVAAFDAFMTQQGIAIGLTRTWFASPTGLNDHGYSTAREVAAMTRWAYRSPTFVSIVATKAYTLRLPSGKRVRLRNLNELLFGYPGAVGVKTGFTYGSHWSLVGVARRGTTRLIVALLDDPNPPFRDGEALLTWGFRQAARSL